MFCEYLMEVHLAEEFLLVSLFQDGLCARPLLVDALETLDLIMPAFRKSRCRRGPSYNVIASFNLLRKERLMLILKLIAMKQ